MPTEVHGSLKGLRLSPKRQGTEVRLSAYLSCSISACSCMPLPVSACIFHTALLFTTCLLQNTWLYHREENTGK